MQVKDLVGAINCAGRAASEIRRIWKEESEHGNVSAAVEVAVLRDWYLKVTRLVMLVQEFEIDGGERAGNGAGFVRK